MNKTSVSFLQAYTNMLREINECIADDSAELDSMIVSQELRYRLSVIGTFQQYVAMAPSTGSLDEMKKHYIMVMGLLKALPDERKYGKDIDKAAIIENRAELEKFTGDIKEFFGKYEPKEGNDYKECLDSALSVYMSIFRALRESYTKIESEGDFS